MRKKYYAQPHQTARTAQDHLNVKLNIFLSVSHKIGASPPNLPKEQKTKVDSTKSSGRLFLGHPHPTFQKNKKQSRFHRIIRKTISVVHNNLR
jgi:hypothetical protein